MKTRSTADVWRGHKQALALLLMTLSLVGCRNTEFYERERLIDPIMNMAGSGSEIHFQQKCYYSREGSVGGFGSSAGGGCGCY